MCSSGRVLTPLAVRRSPSDEFFEVAREVLLHNCNLFRNIMFNQSTWSGITTQTDNQIQYTSTVFQACARFLCGTKKDNIE